MVVLTDEFVAETILWRLPVNSIMKLRCVCKSWYSIITSSHFISNQLRKTLTKKPQMLLYQKDDSNIESCSLLFDYQNYFRSISFHIPHVPVDCNYIRIIGSVNGLICFSTNTTRILYSYYRIVNLVICNPSIGHFHSITPPITEKDWWVRGFGFDERTLDFNILLISPPNLTKGKEEKSGAYIYSLNLNSWRSINCDLPWYWGVKCRSVLFLKGKFHWLAYHFGEGSSDSDVIMVFDVKTGILEMLPFPELGTAPSLDFMEFGESSFAIINRFHKTHIWVKEEKENDDAKEEYDSKEESWIKFTVAPYSQLELLGCRSKDEVLFRCNDGCIASRKINNTTKKLEERKRMMEVDKSSTLSFSVHKYVPTLVLLDKQNSVDVPAPTHTLIDITAQRRTQISDASETPTAETARRSQRIKHKAAKYT